MSQDVLRNAIMSYNDTEIFWEMLSDIYVIIKSQHFIKFKLAFIETQFPFGGNCS